MDLKNKMVIIKGEIKTSQIKECEFDGNKYIITYKNEKTKYRYSHGNVLILEKDNKFKPNEFRYFYNGYFLSNINSVSKFVGKNIECYHITFQNGEQRDYKNDELKLKYLPKKAKDVFSYLKETVEIMGIKTDDGLNLLKKQYNKIKTIDNNSVLYNYINQNNDFNSKIGDDMPIIFPFGCNSSQYEAVKHAISDKVSIIEGPPGTGKTQTILNIIANLIIRGKTCQVVSNNNSAVKNVEEKLQKDNLDFFVALLGKEDNKNTFINNQKAIPNMDEYKKYNLFELEIAINQLSNIINEFNDNKKRLFSLKQQLHKIDLEYRYFKKYLKENDIEVVNLNYTDDKKILKIWMEYNDKSHVSFWRKIKYIFIYKIGTFRFYNKQLNIIISSLQNEIYLHNIKNIREEINKLDKYVRDNVNNDKKYKELSMKYFKKILSDKYVERKKYVLDDIKNDYRAFLIDYPVILSTTFSSKGNIDINAKFDYIIMDEASQIDIATGALALSCANNAVIIGDEKQLPNIITKFDKYEIDNIFNKYDLNESLLLSKYSFLSSIKKVLNANVTLLKEHYRCHPKIINFCNQKFYNNELVIMTEGNDEKDTIKIYKSVVGNHSRDKMSQRQIDMIEKEVLPKIKYEDIGVIAPFNAQVDSIKKAFPNLEVETVHKFQGREKDVIVISTVSDKIKRADFVDDPQLLNVAISRAKKQLFLVVTGNDISNTNIQDFIDYVEYNNFETKNSKVRSIFDFLYNQYTTMRVEFLKNHKHISSYDSENLMYAVIEDVIKEFNGLAIQCHYKLSILISDKSLLNDKEYKYVSNKSHIDFLITNSQNKYVLAIEVDGYKYHRIGTAQYKRDQMKNEILKKYNIPMIRFSTIGSCEKEKLKDKLNNILKNN